MILPFISVKQKTSKCKRRKVLSDFKILIALYLSFPYISKNSTAPYSFTILSDFFYIEIQHRGFYLYHSAANNI